LLRNGLRGIGEPRGRFNGNGRSWPRVDRNCGLRESGSDRPRIAS
jgi:hypothetical protein